MTTIINMDNLEAIKTRLPVAEKIKIHGIEYRIFNINTIIKIMKAIKNLEKAVYQKKADPKTFLYLEYKARLLWDQAVGEFGEDALREAWAEQQSEAA